MTEPMKTLKNYITEKETERLILRTLEKKHVSDAYLSWLSDPEVIRFLEIRHGTHDRESTERYISNMLESEDNLQMGMFLKDGDRHIGNIKLGPINWRYKRADIGLMIGDKECWGKGYATEAIAGIAQIGLEDLGLARVQAGAYGSNKGSVKAFLKAGFQEEGTLKGYWILEDGRKEDEVLVGKVA